MELVYKTSKSSVVKPNVEIGTTTVYIRRNFQQYTRSCPGDEESSIVMWTYEEATLTKDEALLYLLEKVIVDTLSS